MRGSASRSIGVSPRSAARSEEMESAESWGDDALVDGDAGWCQVMLRVFASVRHGRAELLPVPGFRRVGSHRLRRLLCCMIVAACEPETTEQNSYGRGLHSEMRPAKAEEESGGVADRSAGDAKEEWTESWTCWSRCNTCREGANGHGKTMF